MWGGGKEEKKGLAQPREGKTSEQRREKKRKKKGKKRALQKHWARTSKHQKSNG